MTALGTRVFIAIWVGAIAACTQPRETEAPAPVYRDDLESLLEQRCQRCHTGDDAKQGVLLRDYFDAFGCQASATSDEDAGTVPDASQSDDRVEPGARLLRALARPDHTSLLSAHERARLQDWVDAELPLREHGVHGPFILHPRTEQWHGKLAARDDYGPLRDPNHPDVCGRCHAGAPVQPDGVRSAAPGAPACTNCHEELGGALACGVCHGDGRTRAAPPRDACLFPPEHPDAHAAHLTSTRVRAATLPCATCHPVPRDTSLFDGKHVDGRLDVVFDPALAGSEASYDPQAASCNVACHARGGARAAPSFRAVGPLGCGDCHAAPPAAHYVGACTPCHRESNATGSALSRRQLHMNGHVDLGDGTASCGACHGSDQDPTPDSPSHRLHRDTQLTAAITCDACHRTPTAVMDEGHLDRSEATPVEVALGARARARGQAPDYTQHRCDTVACHGAGLSSAPSHTFVWDAAPDAQGCKTCHGSPPAPPHPQDDNCAASTCHGAEVGAGAEPSITDPGRSLHIDGVLQHGKP